MPFATRLNVLVAAGAAGAGAAPAGSAVGGSVAGVPAGIDALTKGAGVTGRAPAAGFHGAVAPPTGFAGPAAAPAIGVAPGIFMRLYQGLFAIMLLKFILSPYPCPRYAKRRRLRSKNVAVPSEKRTAAYKSSTCPLMRSALIPPLASAKRSMR